MREDAGVFGRLKSGLARTSSTLGENLASVFSRKRLDAEALSALEDALIRADVGVHLAHEIAADIGKGRYDKQISESELRAILAKSVTALLEPIAKPFTVERSSKPFLVLVAGVNGTGKTTTIGKLAAKLTKQGQKVWIAACDTFRAAATDQLKIWAERAGAHIVTREPGADAAGLAFDAFKEARAADADVLLIDSAGRLQNKAALMAELDKIARVVKKLDAKAPHATLLVLDATTGQNAISQVDAFRGTVPVTGLILTKLDGTAKGGILIALGNHFGIPVHFVGVGETIDDLQEFHASSFAKALTGTT